MKVIQPATNDLQNWGFPKLLSRDAIIVK